MDRAELARFIDRETIEYVRTYPHPIDRVWRAITERAEFEQWFMPGEIELREGGAYWLNGPEWTGKVLAIEPPRLIRLGATTPEGAPFWFQYELAAALGGTRMRFIVHNEPGWRYLPLDAEQGGDLPAGEDTPYRPGTLGGWHEFWDALGRYLDGAALGDRDARWRELTGIYRTHIVEAFPAADIAEPV